MLVKYCRREHNLLRRCSNIRLGTLRNYCDGDLNFLRRDDREGHYTAIKETGSVLEGRSAAEFARWEAGNVVFAEGSKAVRNDSFPNCFIYCLSQATPSLDLAHCLDPEYDDWFEITNVTSFRFRLWRLLVEQLLPADLGLPSSKSFVGRCHVFAAPVTYGGREVVLDHENFDKAMEPFRNPIRRLFLKPPAHQEIEEYRIALVITDNDARPISVKTQAKYLQLMPSDPILSTLAVDA